MEIEFELSRQVQAPISRCWELLTDPARTPEWMTLVSSAQAEGPPGVGRVIHARGGLLGITTSTRQVVHLYEPERRYGWRGDDPFPLVVELALDMRDDAGRVTELHVRAAAAPGGFFPGGARMLRRVARSQLHTSADRFQELVERS